MALELSPGDFDVLADRVCRAASDYLTGLDRRPSFPATSGSVTAGMFEGPLPEEGGGSAAFDDLAAVADHSRPGDARFFCYALGSGGPVAAVRGRDSAPAARTCGSSAWTRRFACAPTRWRWLSRRTAGRGSQRSRSSRRQARRALAPSIRCARSLASRRPAACGCTSTAPTAAWRRWLCPGSSPACRRLTRSPLMPTNGCTHPWVVARG